MSTFFSNLNIVFMFIGLFMALAATFVIWALVDGIDRYD
jgi:hypothetical protein